MVQQKLFAKTIVKESFAIRLAADMEDKKFIITLINASLVVENHIIKIWKSNEGKVSNIKYTERGILGENSLYKVLVKTIPEL